MDPIQADKKFCRAWAEEDIIEYLSVETVNILFSSQSKSSSAVI